MCFSPPMSAAIGAAALASAGLLKRRGKPIFTYGMFLYFGAMEFLQLAQYAVADQCDSRVNQALTWLAFVHVVFQPLVVNLYFLYGQRNPHAEVGWFVAKLCFASGLLMLMRSPLLPLVKLGDALHAWIPDLPTSDTLGKHCNYLEPFCGRRTCSFKGGAWGHISWELPLAPSTYFLPSASLHFVMFFLPTLLAGDAIKRLLMGVTIFMGPLACMAVASRDMATYYAEWAAIWCFFAALQCFAAIAIELWLYPRGWRAAAPEVLAAAGKWTAAAPPPAPKGTAQAGRVVEVVAEARKRK